MNDGLYCIAPIVDGAAAWPWAQLVIHSQAPSRSDVDPRPLRPAGPTDGAWTPPWLRAVGSNFKDAS